MVQTAKERVAAYWKWRALFEQKKRGTPEEWEAARKVAEDLLWGRAAPEPKVERERDES